MKLVTDKTHRDFYYKNGWIEFDGLLTDAQLAKTEKLVDLVLTKRLKISQHKLKEKSREEMFISGHDLWRDEEALKKIFWSKQLAEIACELNEEHTLRAGSDQLILGEKRTAYQEKEPVYEKYLMQKGSLEDRTCLRSVTAGLLIAIDPIAVESSTPLLSKVKGSGVFFKKDFEIDFSVLKDALSGKYILITYVNSRAVYVLNENDPHTHTLKHLGYVFGDRLTETLHPTIIR